MLDEDKLLAAQRNPSRMVVESSPESSNASSMAQERHSGEGAYGGYAEDESAYAPNDAMDFFRPDGFHDGDGCHGKEGVRAAGGESAAAASGFFESSFMDSGRAGAFVGNAARANSGRGWQGGVRRLRFLELVAATF